MSSPFCYPLYSYYLAGSFAVRCGDHLRFLDHLRSYLGIICGRGSFAVSGSFAALYSIRTIVLLNKLKLFKETSFSKTTMVMRFPPNEKLVAQKHCTISRQEKMAFFTPCRVVLGLPSPSPRVCTERTYADVTAKMFRLFE